MTIVNPDLYFFSLCMTGNEKHVDYGTTYLNWDQQQNDGIKLHTQIELVILELNLLIMFPSPNVWVQRQNSTTCNPIFNSNLNRFSIRCFANSHLWIQRPVSRNSVQGWAFPRSTRCPGPVKSVGALRDSNLRAWKHGKTAVISKERWVTNDFSGEKTDMLQSSQIKSSSWMYISDYIWLQLYANHIILYSTHHIAIRTSY